MSNDLSSTNPLRKFVGAGTLIASVLAVFFVAQLAGGLIVGIVLMLLRYNDEESIKSLVETNSAVQLSLIAAVAVSTIWLVIALLKLRHIPVKKHLLLEKKPTMKQLSEVGAVYIVYFVSLVIVSVILSIFTPLNVDQVQDLGIATPTSTLARLAVFVSLVVIPPIYEEILFRGYLFSSLKKYISYTWALVFTSVLFGIAHLEYGNLNWIAAVDTLIFSGFLIFIAQRHQSLYSSMALHAIKNCIAFYVMFVH